MGKKRKKVRYKLDTGNVTNLPDEDIKAILRAADEIIATGGRNMLAKILKGSKEKKLLEYGLDQCPVYGYYKMLKLEEIMARVDWIIVQGYLDIKYSGRLPMIVFTEKGWEIERDTYSDELLQHLRGSLSNGDFSFVHELKDRNRGMILLLLNKIEQTGDKGFIPLLKAWQQIEYRKVRAEIQRVINSLNSTKVIRIDFKRKSRRRRTES